MLALILVWCPQVNEALREASRGAQAGILAVVDEPLVSVDFRCTDVSTSIDSSLTMVMGASWALDFTALRCLLILPSLEWRPLLLCMSFAANPWQQLSRLHTASATYKFCA